MFFGSPAAHTGKHVAAIAVSGHHNCAADEYLPGFGHRLKPRGHVDAVTIHIAIIFDDIAEVDAYAQLKRAVVEPLLDCKCGINGLIDARKHRQKTVAGRLEGAAAVARDCGVDQIVEYRPQLRIGGSLVFSHQQAVADDVSGHDRSKLAFHHRSPCDCATPGLASLTFRLPQAFRLDAQTGMRSSTQLINA